MVGIDSAPEIEAKVKGFEELLSVVEGLRKTGKTIVTNNGSYDIMHIGHVLGLYEAKRQGDVLIVGINSDKSVKQYKGPKRPINPEEQRVRMVAAIGCVDYVFLFDETEPMGWLDQVKPDVHTNGAEYTEDCIEAETVQRNGGRIHLLPMVQGVKTTMMIEKICDIYGTDR